MALEDRSRPRGDVRRVVRQRALIVQQGGVLDQAEQLPQVRRRLLLQRLRVADVAVDDPAAAIATVEGVYERVRVLYSHPEIGARYDIIANRDIRILLYGHYRIAYVIRPDSDIDILGVFHGALEINRYIL